jgi:hypothetical protein
MAKNLLDQDSADQGSQPVVKLDDPELTQRKFYFINEIVEDKLRRYIWTACTDVDIRDSIMSHATELITQIIRKQNLHIIYPGQEESAFGDLVQTAWVQIERTLYKFRSRPHCRVCYNPDRPMDSLLYIPQDIEYGIITFDELFIWLGMVKKRYSDTHLDTFRSNWRNRQLPPSKENRIDALRQLGHVCPYCDADLSDDHVVGPMQGRFGGSVTILFRGNSKVFNMWSQVARTVILAFVKKEGRDKKNSTAYRDHLSSKVRIDEDRLRRFFTEAEELCKHNDDHMCCLNAMQKIIREDDKPWDGIIGKLVGYSGLSRSQVTAFIKSIRLRSFDFTDSPLSQEASRDKYNRKNLQPGSDHEEY